MEEVLDNTAEITKLCVVIKLLLISIKKTFFNGAIIQELAGKISQLSELLSAVTNEQQIEKWVGLLNKIAELKLEGEYKEAIEEKFVACLVRVMNTSSPHQGLKLNLVLIGQCLGVINNFSSREKIREVLQTRGPGNFHLFYFFQHAVRDSIGRFNPRHYSNINSLITGPKLLRSIKGSWELPSTGVVIEEMVNGFVSFNIQDMLCRCVSANHGFMRKTAEFLIDQCGGDIEKSGAASTFLQKAINLIDKNDESSLDALKFYIERQNNVEKTLEQLQALYRKEFGFCEKDHELFKPEYESYGISSRVKYVIAIEFLENKIKATQEPAFERAYADISVAAAAKFRSPVHAAEGTSEEEIKVLRVKQLLERYLEQGKDLSEIQQHLQSRTLDAEEERLLIEHAREIEEKLATNIQQYINYIRQPAKSSSRV